ncbi:PREDICTED: mitochondrial inner membrane protein COX18 [Cyphomyrmex costatus]|uniref:Mitochondrial inner membrane protein COX18 n=1 Tax=Cyphomyrmex costatus TaxID=456900 RepID=A0A151ILH7_9HYME|nr:PREDICTED: mitochondrial inner membrane protein COX18 [Cyphomyrmex costatus]KYN05481.1 Mitochondrial inner membrane protein COX18 [Cyphomyrmex costatus]
MKIIKLDIFLWRLKRVNKIAVSNATCFNILTTALPYSVCNDCSTKIAKDLIYNNQQSMSNNVIIKHGSKIQNFLYISHPRIVSHAMLYNERKHGGYKSYRSSQYNNIRYLSNTGIDSVAEVKVPMQFNGLFKAISESAPIKISQDFLLLVHDYTGLPWWSVIVLSTIMMRTAVTLPLSLYQLYILAKLENLKYEMDEIVQEMKKEINYGIHKYNWSKQYAKRLYNHSVAKQWNKLIVRENCHPAKTILLVLVQVPLWISLSMSIRNLCYMLPKQDANAYITYQEFITDGFLWMSNLTTADPFVLPISMGLFNLAIIEITCMSRVVESTKWQRYLTNCCRIATIGMIPIAMSVPSCLSLYWATSSAFGLFQNLILLSPKLRRFAKVPITTSESPHPYLILRNKIAARCCFKGKMEIPPKI